MSRLTNITKEINRNNTTSLAAKRTAREVARIQDAAISVNEAFVNANLGANQLISGGATWVTGLTFLVSDCVFVIDGAVYTSVATTVTLSAADATHPRIDVLAVNIDGTASVVVGTAGATPAKPETDQDTQVEVTFVTIAATATVPSDVSNLDLYLEDAEWSTTASTNVSSADTSDPYAGTKAIKFTAAVTGNNLFLADATTPQNSGSGTLGLWIKPLVWPNTKTSIRCSLYSGLNRISSWLYINHNKFNINSQEYQFVQLPLADFAATGSSFTAINFEAVAKGAIGPTVLIDNIKLQTGLPATDTSSFAVLSSSNAFTAAQGSGITALTDAATVSWNMAPGNVYSLVLDGNRTMAAPTNVQPGFTYILLLYQDGVTGSRTVTWNAVFKWAAGTAPTLTTAVDSLDVITFVADASGNLHGSQGIADSQ